VTAPPLYIPGLLTGAKVDMLEPPLVVLAEEDVSVDHTEKTFVVTDQQDFVETC